MNNKEALILLCSTLVNNEICKPFTNSEISKLISKIKDKNHEICDLYNMDKDAISQLFFDKLELMDKEDEFVNRILKLFSREANLAFAIADLKRWGIEILTFYDDDYPEILSNKLRNKRPALLYYAGNLKLLKNNNIGFSGSRIKNIKANDEKITRSWAKMASEKGYGVIAGGATGVDTFAIQTAIENNGTFIEFLSNSMIERIKKPIISNEVQKGNGLLLSEVSPYASFNVGTAMARNKYIYLLSKRTIVIKAIYTVKGGKKSGGTWNGAIENLNSNYKNLLVIDDLSSKGNKELIEMGVLSIKDVSDKDSINLVFSNNNPYYPVKKKEIDDIELRMIEILKRPETLDNIKLTKKQLENIVEIKKAISLVENSFDELVIDKKTVEKIKKYCYEEAIKSKQPSLFDII